MTNYYLAVDIGASSGRHILGWMEDGTLCLEEMYRFSNGMERRDGVLCWDPDRLFHEIKNGMKACCRAGKIPASMGVDTWGVDFVLLDREGKRLGKTVGYRDRRTDGMDRFVYEMISEEELYRETGIQKQTFNTIYQLMAIKKTEPRLLEAAERFLMIPDYFHFLLTENACQEYTNATTTQLVNAHTRGWDLDLIRRLGYPEKLFVPLQKPGSLAGTLTGEIAGEVGFSCEVVLPPTHDTASAVLAVPESRDDVLYISSGTWSLMGTERDEPDCREESRACNFTNEGGYDYRYRYLKNIMGLWMIQSVKREWEAQGFCAGFGEICDGASRESIRSLVDCNDESFLAPASMESAVRRYCERSGQTIPATRMETAAVIYNSLADCYRQCAGEIERLTGKRYPEICIVGGGANADYLNRLTANATGKTVYAGPTEATAIGNLAAQMIRAGEFADRREARECIFRSSAIRAYRPA